MGNSLSLPEDLLIPFISTKGNAGLLLAGDKKVVFSTLAEKSEKQRLDP